MATVEELTAELVVVKAAINDILLYGQSTSTGGHTLTRANLSELRKMRGELEVRVKRAGGKVELMRRGDKG